MLFWGCRLVLATGIGNEDEDGLIHIILQREFAGVCASELRAMPILAGWGGGVGLNRLVEVF
jgi:hypothetical protein